LTLKLLAPTALVSLMLVGVCVCGALYLNSLHIDASGVLSENVRSTQAAARLEITAEALMGLLRSEHAGNGTFTMQVQQQNQTAHELLREAEDLANLPGESELVPKIAIGLEKYLNGWNQRKNLKKVDRASYDKELAKILERDVLKHCIALRAYNLNQVRLSDERNRDISVRLGWGLLVMGLGGPLGGLALGYLVARHLHQSISELSVRIRDAAGRLNRELGSVILEENWGLPGLQQHMQHIIKEIERVIDQLQQREHEILRAEQLAAVGQVAAGVAHELRNPLTSIKMLVQTGLEGAPPPGLPPDDLTIIEQEIRRMEQYLQTFLDFARPPCSVRRPTDLGSLVRRALALVEGRAARQKVTLTTALPALPVFLKIDPEQIHQVLVNLLLNALDALLGGGSVSVEVERRRGSPHIEVRVRDSGPGLPPRIREHLFEPFTTTKENGLGLGLSICKRLIEAHGGTIRGDDARGGAVFTFTLPTEKENGHADLVGCG
jgi:signal transduction histidine kinase